MTTEVQLGYTVCLGVGLVLHAIGCGGVRQLRQRGHNTNCRLVFHLPLHLSSTKPVLVVYTYGQLKSHELCLCQLYRKKKVLAKSEIGKKSPSLHWINPSTAIGIFVVPDDYVCSEESTLYEYIVHMCCCLMYYYHAVLLVDGMSRHAGTCISKGHCN